MGGTPDIPKPPPPPAPAPAPTLDSAREAQQRTDKMISRKGRAATILSGPEGDLRAPSKGKTYTGE
jgi:hypothetical protein